MSAGRNLLQRDTLRYAIGCALLLALAAACASAQSTVGNCAHNPTKFRSLNTADFFEAFGACTKRGDHKSAALMIVLGQIRVISDAALLTPINENEEQRMAQLYSDFYHWFGGPGVDELYRNNETVDALVASIEDAGLTFQPDYDPGWRYKTTSKTDIYDEIISSTKRKRIWQLRNYALLIQNDVYYAGQRALDELRQENPMLHVGTPEYDEWNRINAIMHTASETVKKLPRPEDTIPYMRLYEPDADANFRQVGRGFNGPRTSSIELFETEGDVRGSWLSRALPADRLNSLVADVDFRSEILLSVAFGKRVNASDAIFVTRFGYTETWGGYRVATVVGVIAESCGIEFADSFPFVLAVTNAGPQTEIRSSSSSNFPAECGPIRSGVSSEIK